MSYNMRTRNHRVNYDEQIEISASDSTYSDPDYRPRSRPRTRRRPPRANTDFINSSSAANQQNVEANEGDNSPSPVLVVEANNAKSNPSSEIIEVDDKARNKPSSMESDKEDVLNQHSISSGKMLSLDLNVAPPEEDDEVFSQELDLNVKPAEEDDEILDF